MDLKNFASAIAQIAEEKEIPHAKAIEIIETALAAAYKKDYGRKGQLIKTKLNPVTGELKFWQIKLVVDGSMLYTEEELAKMEEESVKEEPIEEEKKIRFNEEKHVMVEEAQKIVPEIKAGEELEIPLETHDNFGRIAAQTAKQVILQKIREAEREMIFSEYKNKEGEIVSGMVQRLEGKNIFLDIGKTLGILPREEQVTGEFYRPGQRLKVYILKVEETPKGPVVFLSRVYPKLISKLFELEVPEISAGQVTIRAIAREPGSRSKIAVASEVQGIDPIGSAVGQRGSRVMAVISELGGEKIDIIEYSDDPEKFIANSLSPAKVLEVKVLPKNRAVAVVPGDQLSLAIGKDGQNVRLAAKLTGWKIDIRSPESIEAEGLNPEEEGEESEAKEEVKEKKETDVEKEGVEEKEESSAEKKKINRAHNVLCASVKPRKKKKAVKEKDE
ncbi:MAG: transcription termination/antitermination protein NusA [Candidatus Nealsonbacteria bacterium CG08_land_8_20_14_0_20_43_11]|uniref:Transcription termination/antitermination protein NusA n=1 Tax=Candidatus Nealsonbacteria bacterium CG08_land_8_20_14_0_20_43_11 TaxID=1974706 RepID=A0A2M6T122_9BACT|nr:MAG: transcription termination/antitermination protein NusA [Candidatus Nealsonbacteria bacterium CG08_land_8_20_14_0_20_43_11]